MLPAYIFSSMENSENKEMTRLGNLHHLFSQNFQVSLNFHKRKDIP